MKTLVIGALMFAAGLASGCVSVLPDAPPPAARYLIEPVEYDAEGAERVEWTLGVDDPLSTRVYDSTKIAVVRAPGRVEFFAAGEWADRAPRLFQAALIRSFENTGRILGVGDRTSLPVSTFVLQTDIRSMQADYTGGAPTAKFTVFARLTNGRGKVYAARLFSREVEADKDDVSALASAFNGAVTAAMTDIVDWSIAEGAKAYAK